MLFDQGVPAPLREHLESHDVVTAHERGWSRLSNGALLSAAENDGFEVLVTTDRNLSYQQNLTTRTIAIVVLGSTRWPWIRAVAGSVADAVAIAGRGTYVTIDVPPV